MESAMAEQQGSNLTPAMLNVLLVLAQGELHGYGIMSAVNQQVQGNFHLGTGTLYRSIHQLLAKGLICVGREDAIENHTNEPRRYYRITAQGVAALNAEIDRLEHLVKFAQQVRKTELGYQEG